MKLLYKPSYNFIESFLGPKYELVTEHVTLTKTERYTDNAYTATVLISNCLPAAIFIPKCDPVHIVEPSVPIIYEESQKNKQKKQEAKRKKEKEMKEAIQNSVNSVYKVMEKFVVNNPYAFLGISPPENDGNAVREESNSVPSFVRIASLFPVERVRDEGER